MAKTSNQPRRAYICVANQEEIQNWRLKPVEVDSEGRHPVSWGLNLTWLGRRRVTEGPQHRVNTSLVAGTLGLEPLDDVLINAQRNKFF
jgi:hypothetical protein